MNLDICNLITAIVTVVCCTLAITVYTLFQRARVRAGIQTTKVDRVITWAAYTVMPASALLLVLRCIFKW